VRRAIGPIVTTGVAIVVAGVVVANPIVAPRADVQIPAVNLSGSSVAAGSMLDQEFLDAFAPRTTDSTNPFSILKQLFTSLAADASYLGKNAIVNAFVAGVTAVSDPELTAGSLPYHFDGVPGGVSAAVAPPPDLAGLAALAQSAGIDPAAVVSGVVNLPAAVDPGHVTATIGSAVNQLASSIVSDAGYVGHELVAAAFAAGAVVAAEPGMIAATLQSLVKGDISGALQKAVAAATAPLQPTGIVINAFVNVFQSHLAEITTGTPIAKVPSALPALSPISPLASVIAPAAPRGVRTAVDAAPASEPAAPADPTPATTEITPTTPLDLAPVVRGLAGVIGQGRPADQGSPAADTPAPAPRTVARDGATQSRDTAHGAAGRGVRGAAPAS